MPRYPGAQPGTPQTPQTPHTPEGSPLPPRSGEDFPSPQTVTPYNANGPQTVYDEETMSTTLPRLHLCSYHGDLTGVLQCITDGHSVHDTVVMRNQAGRLVCGITPLFLAAQRGHYKLVKLLVGNGANPAQPAFIQGSTDLCTPVQVARLNLHIKVTYYLKKAVTARKAEDKVLKEDDETGPAAAQRNAQPDAAGTGAQHVVMANLGDLTGWDPSTGNQPPLQTGNLIARMLQRNKVDLTKWRPDVERTKDGDEQMMASEHRVVGEDELQDVEVANHGAILNNFLRDADLAAWDPYEGSVRGAAASSVAATRRVSMELEGMAASSAYGLSKSNSRAASPSQTREYNGGAPALYPQQQRAPAAAAPAAYMAPAPAMAAGAAAPAARARAAAAAAASSRWYAHGNSDSEDEEDLEASASVPAAAPLAPLRA